MGKKLIKISKQEFIRKILAGEKDLRYVQLPADTDLVELDKGKFVVGELGELIVYLRESAKAGVFKANPLMVNGSSFRGVKMMGLELPFLQAEDADFSGAWLYGVELYKANFQRANFSQRYNCPETCLEDADLSGANVRQSVLANAWTDRIILRNADLRGTDLSYAYLRGADFEGAEMTDANLENAILVGVLNLDKARNLRKARLNRAVVLPREKEMIEQCYERLPNLTVHKGSPLAELAYLEKGGLCHPHHKAYEGTK